MAWARVPRLGYHDHAGGPPELKVRPPTSGAAACGRPLLTTDVPGCRALVRDGVEGLVVSPNDAPALADALARLAGDSALVARLGEAARARVLDGFTERDVMATVKGLYAAMLLPP